MSFRSQSASRRMAGRGPSPSPRPNTENFHNDARARSTPLPDILPELMKIVRKMLPKELPLNMHVRDVEFNEKGCERLTGTLYMTTFRLVFAPDNEIDNQRAIISGNRYIGEYDIPLTSVYKIGVGPVDTHSGFTSFLHENQIRSETRTFSVLTRDFRQITFTKCSVTKSNTTGSKHTTSVTSMETYIDALKKYSHFQRKEQLHFYIALASNTPTEHVPRAHRSHTISGFTSVRSIDDDIGDFSRSDDERIRSFICYKNWEQELEAAEERRWMVARKKFDQNGIIQAPGPYIYLMNHHDQDNFTDFIWHWTHTPEAIVDSRNRRQITPEKNMLISVLGIGEITTATDPLRRVATETALLSSSHYIGEQPFQRYNLAKFPCPLKRLQTSYDKLIEICLAERDVDDDKWLSRLYSSKWLKYVSKSLHGAASLAKLLDFRNIELTGSDTDYNCLMASLIQIFLRPQCRTIKGFCELIVREWIVRGHRFRERFGQVFDETSGYSKQEAPVFLLFLDCVHQLLVQNPFAFEFTDFLLLELYFSVCYCYHHTFIFNDVGERMEAINACPRDLLVISAFDFSLYLYPDACRFLRNEASVFNQEQFRPISSATTQKKARVAATVVYPNNNSASASVTQRNYRTVYSLETPKPSNMTLDVPITNGLTRLHPEQYEYDTIESPQLFPSNLRIDWRPVTLDFWSQCYCRYDQNYLPTIREQQLLLELNSLKEDANKAKGKSKRTMGLDSLHAVIHANSWHPQSLDTRV